MNIYRSVVYKETLHGYLQTARFASNSIAILYLTPPHLMAHLIFKKNNDYKTTLFSFQPPPAAQPQSGKHQIL